MLFVDEVLFVENFVKVRFALFLLKNEVYLMIFQDLFSESEICNWS